MLQAIERCQCSDVYMQLRRAVNVAVHLSERKNKNTMEPLSELLYLNYFYWPGSSEVGLPPVLTFLSKVWDIKVQEEVKTEIDLQLPVLMEHRKADYRLSGYEIL